MTLFQERLYNRRLFSDLAPEDKARLLKSLKQDIFTHPEALESIPKRTADDLKKQAHKVAKAQEKQIEENIIRVLWEIVGEAVGSLLNYSGWAGLNLNDFEILDQVDIFEYLAPEAAEILEDAYAEEINNIVHNAIYLPRKTAGQQDFDSEDTVDWGNVPLEDIIAGIQ
jgi:hypothetical protein